MERAMSTTRAWMLTIAVTIAILAMLQSCVALFRLAVPGYVP